MPPKDYEVILRGRALTPKTVMYRYDLAVHMVSAADGAPEHYTTANNAARTEDIAQALAVEKRTLAA